MIEFMDLIFMFCLGVALSAIAIIVKPFCTGRKQKYGYKRKFDFDYTSKIDSDVLTKDNIQHANKRKEM